MKRLALAVLILAACPALASAGVIHGTLVTPSGGARASRGMNAYPGRVSAMPAAMGAMHGLLADAVIQVDHVPAPAESALAAQIEVVPKLAQKEQTFVPRVTVVAAGSRVDFPNMDPIYHNVFSLSPTKRFDLGKYPRGQSRSVLFNKPGLVNVYCDIHSDMEAFVLVLPHHGFTRPRVNGTYALPDLPPGHYVLRAWHPDLGTVERDVDIPPEGDVTVDIRFGS